MYVWCTHNIHALVNVCTLYLLQRGTCRDSWEGSKGEVVNQDRQEHHPAFPGCSWCWELRSLSPDPSLIRAPIKSRAAPLLSRDNLLFPGLSSHHETRAQEHIMSSKSCMWWTVMYRRMGSCFNLNVLHHHKVWHDKSKAKNRRVIPKQNPITTQELCCSFGGKITQTEQEKTVMRLHS